MRTSSYQPREAAARPDGALTDLDTLTPEQAAELAALLGAPDVDAEQLRRLVNAAADLYRWLLHVEDVTRPRAIRAELRGVAAALNGAAAVIAGLSPPARRELNDALEAELGPLGAANGLKPFQNAVQRVQDSLRPGAGKPSLSALRNLVEHLATVYWSHCAPHRRMLKCAGYWIYRAAEMIDPEVTAANVDVVMRDVRKPPRK